MKRDQKIDRRERALESRDSLTKNYWAPFVGSMINLDAEGFQLAVAFIPESWCDKMAGTVGPRRPTTWWGWGSGRLSPGRGWRAPGRWPETLNA
jgi:hypothetical protein